MKGNLYDNELSEIQKVQLHMQHIELLYIKVTELSQHS